MIFENCTFFNITSRIIRDAGGWIKYCSFTNNTAVNIARYGISFGETGYLDVKDNLFMNAAFFPDDPEKEEGDPYYIIGVEPIGQQLQNMGITQEVNISNNSFWRDTAQLQPYLGDRALISPLFNETALDFVTKAGTEATILDEKVDFEDGPPFPEEMLYYNYTPGVDRNDAPFWNIPDSLLTNGIQ